MLGWWILRQSVRLMPWPLRVILVSSCFLRLLNKNTVPPLECV